MCGPRERYGESSFGGGVTLPAGAGVGAGVAGVGFAATAGMVLTRLRRLRDFPPSKTMRPYSATRARLVFTPFCISKSAMAA